MPPPELALGQEDEKPADEGGQAHQEPEVQDSQQCGIQLFALSSIQCLFSVSSSPESLR